MNEQSEALRLADILQFKIPSIKCLELAAAELRRLHKENEALKKDSERLDWCSSVLAYEQGLRDGRMDVARGEK